jgi:hypothetical protein
MTYEHARKNEQGRQLKQKVIDVEQPLRVDEVPKWLSVSPQTITRIFEGRDDLVVYGNVEETRDEVSGE